MLESENSDRMSAKKDSEWDISPVKMAKEESDPNATQNNGRKHSKNDTQNDLKMFERAEEESDDWGDTNVNSAPPEQPKVVHK
jgi:hypothetical protein